MLKKILFLWLVGMIGSGLTSCTPTTASRGVPTASSILIGSGGDSRPWPLRDIWLELLGEMPAAERNKKINALLDLVERDRGYARVAVVRGLLKYVHSLSGKVEFSRQPEDLDRAIKLLDEVVTQRFVDVMGKTIVLLSLKEPEYLFDPMFADAQYLFVSVRELLADPNAPTGSFVSPSRSRWFETPFRPYCCIEVDGMTVPLKMPYNVAGINIGFRTSLLDGWHIGGHIKIFLDGKLIKEEKRTHYKGRGGASRLSDKPIQVRLVEILGRDPKSLVGEHHWRVEAELFAPNGWSAVVVDEWSFTITHVPAYIDGTEYIEEDGTEDTLDDGDTWNNEWDGGFDPPLKQ